MTPFRTDPAFADELDANDALAPFRDEFLFPPHDGGTVRYFAGNSLGLQPRGVRAAVEQELEDWARLGVAGHETAVHPWYRTHERFRGPLARLLGAREDEVVAMNSLTVNLHLLLVTFFRPAGERRKILVDTPIFPSDLYAVKTHLASRGLDPERDLLTVGPRPGEETLREEDVEALLEREGSTVATALFAGVNFLTGQYYDLPRLVRAAHAAGATCGLDLAHAAGNVPLELHAWDVDFAAWCSYKYLNAGPGALSGAFVHERHARNPDLPRYAGWWANDPDTRFARMLDPEFVPRPTADGWQLSNPSVFGLAPLGPSLELFDRAGRDALRAKSVRLTGYFATLVGELCPDTVTVLTPSDPERRGCQLSLRLAAGAREMVPALAGRGIVCDFREPDVLRAAPTPLYNSFADVRALVGTLAGEDAR